MPDIPDKNTFASLYSGQPPWDIGKPQKPFIDLAEQITGSILDAGCGTGDNALFFASRGHKVTGIDFLEEPILRAKRKAVERGLSATFLVKDALTLQDWSERFDNVIDCGLFHVFSDEDRQKYVAGLATILTAITARIERPRGMIFFVWWKRSVFLKDFRVPKRNVMGRFPFPVEVARVPLIACPPPADLERLFLGGLSDKEVEAVEQHVLQCASCLDKLKQLFRTKETLARVLRDETSGDAFRSTPVVQALIEKLESLRSASASSLNQGTAMIVFRCSACGKKLSVKETLVGKKVKCPGCGQVTVVPAQVAVAAAGNEDMRTLPPTANRDEQTLPPSQVEVGEAATQPPMSKPDATMTAKPDAGHDSSLTDFLAPPQADDELGRLGKYRILKILGHGGMGVVYKAEDPKLKRTVAIKAMLPGMAASASCGKRFLREAEAMAAVEHDHIVRIYQIDEERGVPFLAMEFLKGEPLDERLNREEKMPLADVLRIGREIAEALAAAHATGLIHRDIKPGNIWLEAPRCRVKILDFGLARAVSEDSGLTQQGAIIGTPAYMAPEQARGDTMDARCDLFSLGVVLYRLCSGQQPFRGKDTVSTLMEVAMRDPAPPIELNAEVPPELSALVMKLLEKDPDRRFGSGEEVVKALQSLEKKLVRKEGAAEETMPARAASKTVTAPALAGTSAPRRPLRAAMWLLAGLMGIGAVALSVIIIRTEQGDYVIDTDDPDIFFQVGKDGSVNVEDRLKKRNFKLKGVTPTAPGEYSLAVIDEDLGFTTNTFTIKRGERVAFKAWFEPKQAKQLAKAVVDTSAQQATSPLDQLDPAKIPASERFDWQPKELVAVIGEHRQRHWGNVTGLAISPDGATAATCGEDSVVRFWDTATLESRGVSELKDRVRTATYAPAGRHKGLIWCGGSGDTARLVDPKTGRFDPLGPDWVLSHSPPGAWGVAHIAASADGSYLAISGAGFTTVQVWEVAGEKPRWLAELKATHLTPVAFAPGGSILAYRSSPKEVRLVDVARPGMPEVALLSHEHPQSVDFVFSESGKRLAVLGSNDLITLWELAEMKWTKRTAFKKSTPQWESRLAFAKTGKQLAVSSHHHKVEVWDVERPEPKLRMTLDQGGYFVAFTSDDRALITAQTAVRRWELGDKAAMERPLLPVDRMLVNSCQIGGPQQTDQMSVSADGRHLAAVAFDGQVRMWGLGGPEPREFQSKQGAPIKGSPTAFSPDGKLLATYYPWESPFTRLWETDGVELSLSDRFKSTLKQDLLAFSQDGMRAFSASYQETARLQVWDASVRPWQRTKAVDVGGDGDQDYAMRPRVAGTALVFRKWGGGVHVWDVSGEQPQQRAVLHKGEAITDLALSPDGKTLACSGLGQIVLWDLTGKEPRKLEKLGVEGWAQAVCFTPDGKRLAWSNSSGRLVVWDFAAQGPVHEWKLPGVISQIFVPRDGRHIITYNANGTIYVLRLAGSSLPLQSPPTVWTPRAIAEWTIRRGGKVWIGDRHDIAKIEDLPAGDFEISKVTLDNVLDLQEKDFTTIISWKGLNIGGLDFGHVELTDDGLRRLAQPGPELIGLGASATPITGVGFDAWASRPIPYLVLIANPNINAEGWKCIARLKAPLNGLWVDVSPFTDFALAEIASRHSELQELYASGTRLTDAAMDDLQKLTRLKTLDLAKTAVTDAALPKLAKLTQLREINLKSTKVTAKAIAALQKALPNCKIKCDGGLFVPAAVPALSPLDQLDPAKIPASERFDWQPKELVAVIGTHRQRHWGLTTGMAISPDGATVTTCGMDGVRFWDTVSLESRGVSEQASLASAVAYVPAGPRKGLLWWGTFPSKVRLLDPKTGRLDPLGPDWSFSAKGGHFVQHMATSADGSHLALSTGTNTVQVWEVGGEKPRPLAELTTTTRDSPLAFAPGGSILAYRSSPNEIRLVDVAKPGTPEVALLSQDFAVDLVFSGNGKRLAVLHTKDQVTLWDFAEMKWTKRTTFKKSTQDYFGFLAFSKTGKHLAVSAGRWPPVEIWDVDRPEPTLLMSLSQANGRMAFTQDDRALITTNEGLVRRWRIAKQACPSTRSCRGILCEVRSEGADHVGSDGGRMSCEPFHCSARVGSFIPFST